MNQSNSPHWSFGKLTPVPTRTFGTVVVDMFAPDPEVTAGEWTLGSLRSVAESLPPVHSSKRVMQGQPIIEIEFRFTAADVSDRALTSAMQLVATLHNSLEGMRWTCGATAFHADQGFASIVVMPASGEAGRLEAVADKLRATDWSSIGATLYRVHLSPAA